MYSFIYVVDESIVGESLTAKLKQPMAAGAHIKLTHEEFEQFRDGVIPVPVPARVAQQHVAPVSGHIPRS